MTATCSLIPSVEAATGDGNGDGGVTSADVTINTLGKRLPLQRIGSGDLNDDEIVDGADLAIWQTGYGGTEQGDIDGDGDTDGRDFLLWQRNPSVGDLVDWQTNYGFPAPPLTASLAVPEPGTALLGLALVWVVS